MKHIVIDARTINSSTGRYIEQLLNYLQKLDHQNRYTVLVPAVDLTYWQPKNENFTVQECNYKNYSFGEQIGFKRQLDKLAADLVHFCMPQQPILYRRAKVTTVHDLILLNTYNSDKNWLVFHLKQLVGRLVFKNVGRKSNQIIVPSEYTKRGFAQFAKIVPEKTTVTYEDGEKIAKTAKKYALPFKKYLMYAGSYSGYKNIKRLIDAHQLAFKTLPELGLVLVGRKTAASKKMIDYANKISAKQVIFTDFVANEELAWLYQHAEAYVFPSLMEGFGLPGLEAMYYGTPVISSYATCLPEIYGNAAVYFNPLDTNDMVDTIVETLQNPQLLKSLSARGLAQTKKYSWAKCARDTLAVYNQVLGE